MSEGSASESSQSIVDELFKDFITKKISKSSKSTASTDVSKPTKVDEISKLLDLEISSIQAQTKEPSKERDDPLRKKELSNQNGSLSQRLSNELKDFTVQNNTANIPLPPHEHVNGHSKVGSESIRGDKNDKSIASTPLSGSSLSVSASVNSVDVTNLQHSTSKPVGQSGKKMMIPKQLGCMLSTESLSLIKSNEKIDRNGRVWEDGEVPSSNSEGEGSNKEESDSDGGGYPSDTGSINSDKEDWKSHSSSSKHKKKHKHKHKKKKKKKSSKERDRSKAGDDNEKDRKKDKGGREKNVHKGKEKSAELEKKDKDSKTISDKDKTEDGKTQEKDIDINKGKGSDSENSKREGRSSDKEKSDSKRKEKEKKRKRDRSRSRTPKRSKKSRSRSKTPKKSRKSPSPRRSRYGEWDARSYSEDPKKFPKDHSSRSHSRSRSRSRSKRKRSLDRKRERSKERGDKDLRLQIDKAKLRKIAIANALQNMKTGQPLPVQLDVASVKSGGKSVEELTDFCKRISEKEQEKIENAVSDSSEEETAVPSDDEEPLIHHPFKVKDSSNIVMNIRNAKQLPVLTPSEKQAQQASLRLAFPVSSGCHHRASESEWVPVERTTAQLTPTINKVTTSVASSESQPEKPKSIFPVANETQGMDIGAIISERLQAVRKLQANPYDVQALSSMHKAQEKASQWAQSKHLPGQFLGSTGAQVMSQEEIMGDKRHQAWVKKSQFVSAAPVSGGIGMFLLQKMGWKQGEGLGKNHEGNLEPLQVDIKIDRKGLSTAADNPRARPQVANIPKAKDLSHKHPVSALMELCNKRRWGPPVFTIVSEDGPDHKKYFLFKVKVNNVEYQPAVPSSNKKSAKAQCAAVCLQEMGLLPRDAPMNY